MDSKLNFLSLNIGTSATLAGLPDLVHTENLDILFLQEVTLTSDQIQNLLRGYRAAVNIDENNSYKPGTALVWRENIPVTNVSTLVSCRAQVASLGEYQLMNIYAPSGSQKKYEREKFFSQDIFSLLLSNSSVSWFIGGDFNAVLAPIDIEGGVGFESKKSKALAELIKTARLVDVFRTMFPLLQDFTFHRKGSASSRLDKFYISGNLLNNVNAIDHIASLSDHFAVKIRVCLQLGNKINQLKKRFTYWKLNNAILQDENFLPSFKSVWDNILTYSTDFLDIAEWWDLMAKPKIKEFCIAFSIDRKRRRNDHKKFLLSYLKIALNHKNWEEVMRIRNELDVMLKSDLMGIVVRSRYKQNAEMERASLFHACKEGKNSVNNIEALKTDGHVIKDHVQIEKEVLGFFTALFNGYHRSDLSLNSVPFVPDNTLLDEFLLDLPSLEPDVAECMHENINIDELDDIIKNCSSNKAPGLDGLSYEFFRRTWSIIRSVFLRVLQCQLDRLELIESDKTGATRLIPKVTGIPQVDELRPITLLNCDYRILAQLLVKRLKRLLPHIIKSGQLCTVDKKNILFGINNILSTITYANQQNIGACLISLDFFKAYDRVFLSFLLAVMKKMNISTEFCKWIKMLHSGAKTRFILAGGLSRAISLTFSIRQGDPLAMLLYIIFIEPLVLFIEKRTTGCILRNLKGAEAYCDDLNVMTCRDSDIMLIDQCVTKFEAVSGSILSRNKKCEIVGFGRWKARVDWPLNYLRVVQETKVFGIIIMNSFKSLLRRNWQVRFSKFEQLLISWNGRHFDSIFQRIEVVKTFAMSRLYYLSSILPLPKGTAKLIEAAVGKFIWSCSGKILRVPIEVLKLPFEKGGCKLPCITRMSKSLMLTQLLRLLKSNDLKSVDHLGYWVGEILADFLPGFDNGDHSEHLGEYYGYLSSLIVDLKLADHVNKENCKVITNKNLYSALCQDLSLPKVETAGNASLKIAWVNLRADCLNSSLREISYLVIHNKLPVRERMFRIGQANDPYCLWCLELNETLNCDVKHFFCECVRVVRIWEKIMTVMNNLLGTMNMSSDQLIRLNVSFSRCPGAVWLISAFMEKIWNAREDVSVCEDELFGFLRFKFKHRKLGTGSQIDVVSRMLK